MIGRVFRATVHEGREEAFRQFFVETAPPLVHSQPGLVSVTAGLAREETPTEFCMVMVRRGVAAPEAFTGRGWREARVHPDEAGLVRETFVHHDDLVGA